MRDWRSSDAKKPESESLEGEVPVALSAAEVADIHLPIVLLDDEEGPWAPASADGAGDPREPNARVVDVGRFDHEVSTRRLRVAHVLVGIASAIALGVLFVAARGSKSEVHRRSRWTSAIVRPARVEPGIERSPPGAVPPDEIAHGGGRPDERGEDCVSFACHADMKESRHGSIPPGDCQSCHSLHSSSRVNLLHEGYSHDFYQAFSESSYALCFRCHDRGLVQEEWTDTRTGFRDGARNLHYLHVHRRKGRSCRVCHEIHGSDRTAHVRESVPFGSARWTLPINFRSTASGGTCSPGCHRTESYGAGSR